MTHSFPNRRSSDLTNSRDYTVSRTALWNAPGFDVTSITAYRNLKTSTFGDNAIATVPIIPVDVNFVRHYVYQELRAASTLDGPLHLLGGATSLDNRLDGTTNLFLLSNQIDQKSVV